MIKIILDKLEICYRFDAFSSVNNFRINVNCYLIIELMIAINPSSFSKSNIVLVWEMDNTSQ